MKNTPTLVGLSAALLALTACTPLSEHIRDPAAGRNGGFEHTRSGLPLNWMVYSPETIPEGRYELRFDTADFREGAQSLRFLVEECSPDGGWRSPGIAQEYEAPPGTYVLGFWVKSEGCAWSASFGGVSAKTGARGTTGSSEVDADDWRRVEQRYTLTADQDRLRFELSITSPGSLWVDDVSFESASATRSG